MKKSRVKSLIIPLVCSTMFFGLSGSTIIKHHHTKIAPHNYVVEAFQIYHHNHKHTVEYLLRCTIHGDTKMRSVVEGIVLFDRQWYEAYGSPNFHHLIKKYNCSMGDYSYQTPQTLYHVFNDPWDPKRCTACNYIKS